MTAQDYCWKKKWHEPICKKDQDFVLTPIDTYMTVRQGMLTDCMLLTVGNLSLSESLTRNRIRYGEILAAQNSWITDRLIESPIRNLPRREPLYCGWWWKIQKFKLTFSKLTSNCSPSALQSANRDKWKAKAKNRADHQYAKCWAVDCSWWILAFYEIGTSEKCHAKIQPAISHFGYIWFTSLWSGNFGTTWTSASTDADILTQCAIPFLQVEFYVRYHWYLKNFSETMQTYIFSLICSSL